VLAGEYEEEISPIPYRAKPTPLGSSERAGACKRPCGRCPLPSRRPQMQDFSLVDGASEGARVAQYRCHNMQSGRCRCAFNLQKENFLPYMPCMRMLQRQHVHRPSQSVLTSEQFRLFHRCELFLLAGRVSARACEFEL
jgi:hypothetical protein